MIVSASYRTDIPALHGAWFADRLEAGFVEVASPYGGKPSQVDLTPEGANGFVFWTKHIDPFWPVLERLAAENRLFVVQFTVTGYGRGLERGAPQAARAAAAARRIHDRFGPRALVWRYDPIVLTEEMSGDWHAKNFAMLARMLAGAADEVVASFMTPYAKTVRNLAKAGVAWRDPPDGEKAALLARLAEIAADHGMRLTLCTQPSLVTAEVAAASCIDATRLSDVADRLIAAPTKGNRPGCLCAQSRDIGAYDNCTLGCAYCYAVNDHATVRQRRAG